MNYNLKFILCLPILVVLFVFFIVFALPIGSLCYVVEALDDPRS